MASACVGGLVIFIVLLLLVLGRQRNGTRFCERYPSGGTAYDPSLVLGAGISGPLPRNPALVYAPSYPFVPTSEDGFYTD